MLATLCLLVHLTAPAHAQSIAEDLSMIQQIEIQRLAPRSLTPYVNSRDPEVREQAARSLGRIRSPGALPPLRMLLTDPVPDVRLEAAFAMGQIPGGTRSLVLRLQQEDSAEVRAQILQSLGRICDSQACVEVIRRSLTEEAMGLAPSPIRDEATRAIGRLAYREIEGSRSPAIVSQLLGQLSLPSESTRQASAFALECMRLSELPDTMAEQLFREARTEPDPVTQAWLVRSTGHLQGNPREQAGLYSLASQDPDPGVRIAAARAAATSQWSGITQLLDDPDPGVRWVAIRATGLVRGIDHREHLAPILEALETGDSDPYCAAEALRALAQAQALGPSEPWLAPGYPIPVRIAAVELSREASSLLALALGDPSPAIRSSAALTLMQFSTDAESAKTLIGANDPVVADHGASWLKDAPQASAENALISLLESAQEPRSIETAALALHALYAGANAVVRKPDTRAVQIAKSRAAMADSRASQSIIKLLKALGEEPEAYKHSHRLVPGPDLQDVRSARVLTSKGELIIELFPDLAPLTVWNFVHLAEQGFYDGRLFHRVEPGFILATGDPRGDGHGAPVGIIPDEPHRRPHLRGSVSMSLDGPDTAASQWFITLSPQPLLDGDYTTFGQVIAGQHLLPHLQPEDEILRIQVERVPRIER